MRNIILSLLSTLGLCSACHAQDSIRTLSPQEYAHQTADDTTAVILDVRQPAEYKEAHLQDAVLLDVLDEAAFRSGMQKLDPTRTYYIYCRSGRRSHKAAVIMQEAGLRVADMQGGILAWTAAGLPVVRQDKK